MSKKNNKKDEERLKKPKKEPKRRSISKTREPSADDDDNGFDDTRFNGRDKSDHGKKQILENFIKDSNRDSGSSRRSKAESIQREDSQYFEQELQDVPDEFEDRVKFGRDDVDNNNIYNYRAANGNVDKDKRGNERWRWQIPEMSRDTPIYMPKLTGVDGQPLDPVAVAVLSIPKAKSDDSDRRNSRDTQHYPPSGSRRKSTDSKRDKERRKSRDTDDHGHYHGDKHSRRRHDDRDSDDDDRGRDSHNNRSNHGRHESGNDRHRSHDADRKGHRHTNRSDHHRRHHDVPPSDTFTASEISTEGESFETSTEGEETAESFLHHHQHNSSHQVSTAAASRKPTLLEEQTPENIAKYFGQNPIQVMTVHVKPDRNSGKASRPNKKKSNSKNKKSKSKKQLVSSPRGGGTEMNLAKKMKNLHSRSRTNKKVRKKRSIAPFLDITDFESYYNYVYREEFVEPSDREDEWLDLSTTDNHSERMKIKSFDKNIHAWMLEGISYESQNLTREMRFFDILCLLTGRKFYFPMPNFYKGHVDYIVKRSKQLPFFFTTFILWTSLVLSLQSYADIITDESESDIVQIEHLEIEKYYLFLVYVMANLLLISLWSLIVILKDCHIIAHYFNCWCAALAEMETTASLQINRVTYVNVIAWVVAAVILSLAFTFDYPQTVRGTSGVVSIFLFRGLIADIRLREDSQYLPYQIAGLVFILYVMLCSRLLFCLMQILSLIIKNSAEMWNFKFALTFDQLSLTNRGQMKQIKLNFPLFKIFSHHRIITALLKIYGEIFAVPISIYIVTQMMVFTVVLLFLFNYQERSRADYKGQSQIVYQFKEMKDERYKELHILYFHTPAAELATAVYVLLQVLFDFVYTTEIITNASSAFFDGFEFVRRTSLILCENSHQRRLIQSLLWSMSSVDASLLTAANYYSLTKQTIASALSTALVFFSLIIQLRRKKEFRIIEIEPCASGSHAAGDRCSGISLENPKSNADGDGDKYILKLNPR